MASKIWCLKQISTYTLTFIAFIISLLLLTHYTELKIKYNDDEVTYENVQNSISSYLAEKVAAHRAWMNSNRVECPVFSMFPLGEQYFSNNFVDDLTDQQLLIPIYANGPNNQVKSFYEAANLASVLNRTLVLTPMYRHNTDEYYKTDPFVPLSLRLDLTQLASHLPKIKLTNDDPAMQACHYSLSSSPLFVSKKQRNKDRYDLFSKYYGVSVPELSRPEFQHDPMYVSDTAMTEIYIRVFQFSPKVTW